MMSADLMSQLFAVIAPVFIAACLGFSWAKAGLPFETNQMTLLITNVGTPCLVVSTLLHVDLALTDLGTIALASLSVQLTMGLAGFAILKLSGLPNRAFLPSLMYPNNGNMGLPICLFAFGEPGLALAIAYFTVSAVGQFTVGQALSSGHASLLKLLRTPIVWGVIVAVCLIASGSRLPPWADNTVNLLGQFTIPLMLIALGVSLARMHTGALRRSGLLVALRILAGTALGFAVAWLLDLDGIARAVVILQASMPAAVFNYLFAQLHGNRPEEVAGVVMISTLMSLLSLPLLLWLLL